MKNKPLFKLGKKGIADARHPQSGVALVIVLAILVLVAVLVVGFLNRATSERTSSSLYYESNRNGFLADAAVNLVQAQIDHAATQPGSDGKSAAWASQPGMVRSFKPDGSLLHAYKLYSDAIMVTGTVNLGSAVTNMTAWWDSPAHLVDLNEPVFVTDSSGASQAVYPILDNAVLDSYTQADNGFAVSGAPVNPGDLDESSAPRQRIPMPVQWLYVLEDGSLVAPSGSGSTATISGASRQNPIVGRMAFWTDDETCKLNINTASHGFFWDIPRVSSFEDRDRMARFQPARREFQRYPGHPATTSLRPAFRPGLFADDTAFANFVYGIAPRIAQGGSEGGTLTATDPIDLDDDRLYASVDELLFTPARNEGLDPSDLEEAKFFLTARSNSPEVNLFNLPRMAIWPINAGDKTPSTLDELIAFCATINGQPYYLQRQNPSSSTEDFSVFSRNKELWDYVVYLLGESIPGFGATSFADKYSASETKQITTEIFDYIRSSNLFSTALGATPYTGDVRVLPDSLEASRKPGTRAGQVTPLQVENTKGFGRIPMLSRAVFQLYISGARAEGVADWIPPTGEVPVWSSDSGNLYDHWRAWLDSIPDPAGGGDKKLELLTTGIIYFDTFDPNIGYTAPRYNFTLRTNFSGGWTVNTQPLGFANTDLKINLDQNYLYNSKTDDFSNVWFSRFLGGALGPQWTMQNYAYLKNDAPNAVNRTSSGINYGQIITLKGAYPLVSQRVAIHIPITLQPKSATEPDIPILPDHATIQTNGEWTDEVVFSGGNLQVELLAGGIQGNENNGGEVVQTYNFVFPGFTKPAPIYSDGSASFQSPRSGPYNAAFSIDKQLPASADFRLRLINAYHQHGFYGYGMVSASYAHLYDTPDLRLVQDGDVAVSLVPTHGDKRLLAAKSDLTMGPDFQVHEYYTDPARRAAVDFRTDVFGRQGYRGMSPGSWNTRPGRILNLNYGSNGMPDIPGHLANGLQAAPLSLSFVPDFDNAPFYFPDDAYINRPDEGSVTDFLGAATGSAASGGSGGREVAWYVDRPVTAYAAGKDREEFFSPARQMPSAGMFGSLPTGVMQNKPWQTLLFRPDPGNHPGAANPPDYALLDLFWMPVVEPYAISEPFSSNGKVNMNFQIAPFTYITRANALHGVMQSEEMLVVPDSQVSVGTLTAAGIAQDETSSGGSYKMYNPDNFTPNKFSTFDFRQKLDAEETLKGFAQKFAANEIFFSETQICSLPLIPEGETWAANFESSWWSTRRLTGDNSRERPYANLLPKLTTKSNTYTVHYRVQSLKKLPAASDAEAALWDENKDRITSEHRGSRTIERYIDPDDQGVPNYAGTLAMTPPLADFYRWRTLANREFSP